MKAFLFFLLAVLVSPAVKAFSDVGTREFFHRLDSPVVVTYNDDRTVVTVSASGRTCGFAKALFRIEADDTGVVTSVKAFDITKVPYNKGDTVITIDMAKNAVTALVFKPA